MAKVSALQQSGRLKEAFELCREINKSDPANADAYNLGGVIAFQGGNAELGLRLLRKAVATGPDHAGAHNNLGIVLKETGALEAAVSSFGSALSINPNDADAEYNLGNTFSKLERFEDAAAAYARAVAIRPDFFDGLFNLGITLATLERFDQAAEVLQRAVDAKPDVANAHLRLGSALEKLGKIEAALGASARAVELAPNDADAIYDYANMLANHEQYADAVQAYRRVLDLKPDFIDAEYKLARSLFEVGEYDAAVATYESVLRSDPDYKAAQYMHLEATLGGFGPDATIKKCDERLARNSRDQFAIAIKAAAMHLAGQREAASELLGLDRYIRDFRIAAPMGFAGVTELNEALTEVVCNHPSLEHEKSGHATRNGGHTGHINVNPEFPVAVLEQSIRDCVATYIQDLPKDKNHPFPAALPSDWKLNMWAVVMKRQGHQVPHIHPAAWLSGVYYPRLPNIVNEGDENKSGWIEFGRVRDLFHDEDEPELKVLKPEEGLLFLFPAYMYHRTIPFDSDEIRVSIAFDIVPKL